MQRFEVEIFYIFEDELKKVRSFFEIVELREFFTGLHFEPAWISRNF